MAARGNFPSAFEGRTIQAPGMLRHGPFPGLSPAGHRPLEPMPPIEFLENNIAVQGAEMDRIARENQRLAETHVVLRQQLGATQQDMQGIQADVRSIHTESDIQVRGLVEKIGKMEVDMHAGDTLRKELQQAHLEAQSLLAARQELAAEIQRATEELQKASADRKNLPDMHGEVEALRGEHQKLRAAFEYEKGVNMDQVERMQAMDKNLISLAKEVEKLRTEVANVEKKASAPNPYGSTYGSPGPAYPPAGQGSGYPPAGQGSSYPPAAGQGSSYTGYAQGSGYRDAGYAHAGGYTDGGYGQSAPASYAGAYGRPQAQVSAGAAPEGMHSYGGMSSAGYPDGYARMQVQATSGAAAAADGTNPYGASGAAPYDAARGPPAAVRR